MPSYHDLYVTAPKHNIARTSIFNIPYGWSVSCNRVGGWELSFGENILAGEYNPDGGLFILDVDGHVIVDNSKMLAEEKQ